MEQISHLTASNAELSTNVATLNTEKTRLDVEVKECRMNIKKLTDEKKDISRQVEEANKSKIVFEQKLCDAEKEVDGAKKSMKKHDEDMQLKLKENASIIEGKQLMCYRITLLQMQCFLNIHFFINQNNKYIISVC